MKTTTKFGLKLFAMLICFCLNPDFAITQDISEQAKQLNERLNKDPFKIGGGIQLGASGVFSNLDVARAIPFSARGHASLNLDFLGVKAPFSLTYSTGGKAFNYSLPSYAFAGISPSYKWVKLHLGDRSMGLGRYVYSGQSFRGAGIELSPNNWKVASFYGRIRRTTAQNINSFQRIDPLYKRMGYGLAAGFDNKVDKLMVSVLHGKDDLNSLPFVDSTLLFNPASNTVWSVQGNKKLTDKLSVGLEWAKSAFTENSKDALARSASFYESMGGLEKINQSTRWGTAFNAFVKLNIAKTNLEVNYEKVSPGFKTMGALYFRNDYENINAGLKFPALNKKLLTNLKIGIERNNLKNTNANEYSRFVFNLNTQYRLNPKTDFGLNASTFNNTIVQSTPLSISNPLEVNQLLSTNANYGAYANYQIQQNEQYVSVVSVQLGRSSGYTVINDEIQNDKVSSNSIFVNYNKQNIKNNAQQGLQISYIQNGMMQSTFNTVSLAANLTRPFLNKKSTFNITLGGGLNMQKENGLLKNVPYTQSSVGFNYQIDQKTELSFNNMLYKNFGDKAIPMGDLTELRSFLSFNFRI